MTNVCLRKTPEYLTPALKPLTGYLKNLSSESFFHYSVNENYINASVDNSSYDWMKNVKKVGDFL